MIYAMNFDLATHQEISQALGQRLHTQRLAQNLSQAELAARAGVGLATLKRLEQSGACSMEALIRVAQALGLAGGFEALFVLTIRSIAQMEQAGVGSARRRAARQPKTRVAA
jgi:transcriptional regulator with XRE-family HTH domain